MVQDGSKIVPDASNKSNSSQMWGAPKLYLPNKSRQRWKQTQVDDRKHSGECRKSGSQGSRGSLEARKLRGPWAFLGSRGAVLGALGAQESPKRALESPKRPPREPQESPRQPPGSPEDPRGRHSASQRQLLETLKPHKTRPEALKTLVLLR